MDIFEFKKNKADLKDNKNNSVTLSNGENYEISHEVDCLGDSCPRPQLMTKKIVAKASSLDVIQILIDNPTSMEAIPPMCPGIKATHLETIKADRHWNIYVRKN